MEVWTDGRINPKEAVHRAAAILREHLSVFMAGDLADAITPPPAAVLNEEEKNLLEKLLMNVSVLELSVRAANCLASAQIQYIGELVEKSESQMLKYRNFGKLGIQGSAFGLGCMRFNGAASGDSTIDEQKAISLIRRAIKSVSAHRRVAQSPRRSSPRSSATSSPTR